MAMETPKIIYQDESFFVVEKPSGWITNEADTTTTQPVLQTWIKDNFNYPLKDNFELRNGIVHRLDKETSGIVLVAKTQEAFEKLQAEFKERKVEKYYLALAHGKIEPGVGEIKVEVGRLPWRRDRFGVLPGGREAETHYQVEKNFQKGKDFFSLVKLFPKTGRTHQIRIHLKYLGHPIVADNFYAGRKTSRNDRTWCLRLFLHAAGISFFHPQNNEKVSFESELPQELENVLISLKHL